MKKISLILFYFYSFLAFSDAEIDVEISLFKPERSDPAIIDSIVVDPVIFANRIGLPRNYEFLSRAQRRQIIYEVGDRYFRNQAYEEALFWLLVATKRGLPEAKYKLAVLYRDVFPERSTVGHIFNLFLQAAKAGVVEAQQEIAYIYLGVEPNSPFNKFTNLKKASEWYTQLANSGVLEAQYNLAKILYNQGNKEAAFQRYLEAANNGLGVAQLRIARMLELGDGVTQDFVQAILWYRKAIVGHEAYVKYRLSMMYREGRGVNKDEKKAARLRNEAVLAQGKPHQLNEADLNTYINVGSVPNNTYRETSALIDINTTQVKSDSTKATNLSTFLNAHQAESSKKPFMDNYPSQVMYEAHQKGDLLYEVKPGDLSQEEIYDARIALSAAEKKIYRVSLSPEEEAIYNTFIGNIYRSGLINSIRSNLSFVDTSMATIFFEQAIGQHVWSNGTAEYWLGLMHEFGRGVDEKSETKAIEFYKRSIRSFYETYDRYQLTIEFPELDSTPPPRTHPLHSIGLAEAYYRLAKIHENKVIKDKNQVINFQSRIIQRYIISHYEKAARLGLAAAQFRLSEIFMEGLFNTTRDVEKAIHWLRKVIFQSVNIQTHKMHAFYVTSARYQLDLERLMKAQFYLAHILAEQRNAEAAFNLADMYAKGRGVARNIDRAVYWYEQSMTQDYIDAYTSLARIYQEGRGVTQDVEKAERLYKEATVRGSAEAPYLQALIYEERILLNRTMPDAQKNELLQEILRLHTVSANRGFVSARISIAKMYEEGRGVAQDLNKALDFYEEARFQGSKEAQENFDRLLNNVPGRRCMRAMLSVVN